ncbi:MAG: hypothetical protein WCI74_11950, partial [Actinomycetes bacterium]
SGSCWTGGVFVWVKLVNEISAPVRVALFIDLIPRDCSWRPSTQWDLTSRQDDKGSGLVGLQVVSLS